jgi:tetratricopeptide (TPR) repeat protein
MLLVLDNAATVDQVRPLLPGSPDCLVVVTSRDSLSGLVARDGARRLDLDLLPAEDAVRLLGSLIGARVAAEPAAARTLADQCARLPLALRVAAELAATRSTLPLSELVDELADQHRRLDLLDAGLDHRTAVRAVFSRSYQHLTDAAAAAFRLAGLHPGPDLDPYAVAALNDIDLPQARRLLDVLSRASLIQAHGRGRYGVHDLLRAYARDLAATEHTDDERRGALTRLFDFYVATAAAAMNLLHPSERHRRPRVPRPTTPVPDFATTDAARSWLEAEKPNLVAACVFGEAHAWPAHTVALAATLFRWLDGAGHNSDSFTVHSLARRGAERIGDTAGEARALVNLGLVYWHQGMLGRAAEHLSTALDRYTRIADHIGQACALSNLGVVHWRLGRLAEAEEHLHRALDLYERLADPVGQAEALGNLGLVYQRQGQLTTAIDHHRRALALFREAGYRIGEAYALNDLGTAHMRLGQPAEAARSLRQALLQFRELDVRAGEAEALNGLGEALFAAGAPDDAAARHADALAVAVEIGDRYEQGRAHAGMATVHESLGELDRARRCREQALTAYRSLDVPEAETEQARLTARA